MVERDVLQTVGYAPDKIFSGNDAHELSGRSSSGKVVY